MEDIEIQERLRILKEYFETKLKIGEKAFNSIQSSMFLLKKKTASDITNLIASQEECISYSDDLNWIILILKKRLHNINKEINKIKSPATTMLINKGRMGNDLINQEILFLHDDLYDLYDSQNEVTNIINYLETLNENLNKYLWIIREKLKY